MYYRSTYESPLGLITLVSTEDALVGLWLEKHRYGFHTIDQPMTDCDTPAGGCVPEILRDTKLWLDDYFVGKQPDIGRLKLKPSGSQFRRDVWKILCDIPYGQVITYGDIAKQLAAKAGKKRMSAQAVGGAVGHNPISIIIPCHRVVGSTGSLTGYGGGIQTKVRLLTHEGLDMTKFTVPTKGTAL